MRVAVRAYRYVIVLVEEQGRYLLIQEAKPERGNPWYFPGGGMEPGEDLYQAARREAMEEAGVVIEPSFLLGIEHYIPETLDKEPGIEQWRFFLVARWVQGLPKTVPDQESLQARWFLPEEIPSLHLRAPEVLTLLEQYQKKATLLPLKAYQSNFS
jgi:8-oxo-dGTP pyrophosphatase MutT (NUDIX family)